MFENHKQRYWLTYASISCCSITNAEDKFSLYELEYLFKKKSYLLAYLLTYSMVQSPS